MVTVLGLGVWLGAAAVTPARAAVPAMLLPGDSGGSIEPTWPDPGQSSDQTPALEPPRESAPSTGEDRPSRFPSSDLPVPYYHAPEARGDRIRIGGDVRVRESDAVHNVVAVFGTARIDGYVSEDVVAVAGDVRLGPRSVVRGTVTSVGGRIFSEPGAVVTGQLAEVQWALPEFRVPLPDDGQLTVSVIPDWPRVSRITWTTGLVCCLLLVAFGIVAALAAPAALERIRERAAQAPIASFFTGVLAQILILPVFLGVITLIGVTIIGLPLLGIVIPVFVLGYIVASALGIAGVATAIGAPIVGRDRPLPAFLLGSVALLSIGLIGRYLWMNGGGTWGVGPILMALGFTIEYFVWTLGVGALLLARSRRRRETRAPAVAPTPPPEPERAADEAFHPSL